VLPGKVHERVKAVGIHHDGASARYFELHHLDYDVTGTGEECPDVTLKGRNQRNGPHRETLDAPSPNRIRLQN
jgi:hypothetical protein